MFFRRELLLLAATVGCYGTPHTTHSPDEASAGHGGSGGAAGTGGAMGTGGAAGTAGTMGTGGAGGASGGTGTGVGIAGNGGGTGGTTPTFVGGPCIATPDRQSAVEVFGRASDGHVYRRAFDGRRWGSWSVLAGLDGSLIDARSDLDCGASSDTIHIVATGLNPPGALIHAFGFGTSYNPFSRLVDPAIASQSPSIALIDNARSFVAWAAPMQQPALYDLESAVAPALLTPITTLTDEIVSGPDVSIQLSSVFVAAFDSTKTMAIYPLTSSSAGYNWRDPVRLFAPAQPFAFNPTICAETGFSGSSSINVAAVSGHELWFAGTTRTPAWPPEFSWATTSTDAASSPDCAVLRETPDQDAVVHIVTLSARGTIVDVQGNGTSWATTDLGLPP
jgi:hypothetical protein